MATILLLMWVTKCLKPKYKMPVFPSEALKLILYRHRNEAKKYDKWNVVVLGISSRLMAHMCISCESMSCACPGWSCIQLLNKSMWKKACMQISLLCVPNRGVFFSVQEMLIIGTGRGSTFSKGPLLWGMAGFPTQKNQFFSMSSASGVYRAFCSVFYH